MYILTDEPASGEQLEAFKALDDAFGTGEFSRGQAITVLVNTFEDASKADSLFQNLERGAYITEVE